MAKQDKATYDSYAPDEFDNPPVGPVGVHRGLKSVGARVTPYLVVFVIAILAGALTWSLVTGEFSKIVGLDGTNTAQTTETNGSAGTSDSTDSGTSSDASKDDSTSSDSSDSTGSSSSDSSSNSSDANSDSDTSKSDDQNSDQNADQNADQSAQVNKGTSIRVVNAAGINGYAAQKKTDLESAGYTAVEAANPASSNLPSSTVVWYQNDADKATAQDVASTLGITDVQQVSGLDVPVVVVLLN